MFGYLQRLIPDMLQDLRDNRSGSLGYLGDNYTNEEGILVNDTCHVEWDKILDKMIFLWRESREETCSRKNPFEEGYDKAFDEFHEKYGFLGEKLQTEAELEENRKRGGGGMYTPNELTKYFQELRETVQFKKWFFGHYHDNRYVNAEEILLYEQLIRIA